MTQHAAFLQGLALAATLIVAIGAQNAFVLRQALAGRHVAAIVLLCAGADVALVGLGVAGLGRLLGEMPGLVRALALVGAAYLSAQGVTALRRAAGPGGALAVTGGGVAKSGVADGRRAALLTALGFTLLNPHVYLDTVVLMGGIGGGLPGGARLAFVIGAGTASLVWFGTLGFAGALLRPLLARPGTWRIVDLLTAATMLAIAAALARRGLAG
jgi:L-lysine exporter family protein LysE/ArgO